MINDLRISGTVSTSPIYKTGKSLEFELSAGGTEYSFPVTVACLGKSADYNKSIAPGDKVIIHGAVAKITKQGNSFLGVKAFRVYRLQQDEVVDGSDFME